MRSDTNVTPHVLESFQWTDDNATSLGSLYRTAEVVAATPDAAGRCQAAAAVASRAGRWLRCMLGVAVPLGLIHSFGYRDRTQLTIFFVRTYMR